MIYTPWQQETVDAVSELPLMTKPGDEEMAIASEDARADAEAKRANEEYDAWLQLQDDLLSTQIF